MIEADWIVSAPKRKKIYGRTMRSGVETDSAIVFVHGLTCDLTDKPYSDAARIFIRKGYDCLLFNLYDWRPDARHMNEGTIKRFAADLDLVLKKKAVSYKNVFLIGHSYGGPVILSAECGGIKAVSLWDPSYNIADWWPEWTFRKKGMIFFRGSVDFFVPARMNHEARTLDINACRALGRKFLAPLQVIHAGKGMLYKYGESFHSFHRGPADYKIIPDADHSFTQEQPLKQAVAATDKWFKGRMK